MLAYLQRLSGYSRAQITRLVSRWTDGKRLIKQYHAPEHAFARRYTSADVALLAEVDRAMVQQFVHHPDDYLIWEHYDALNTPVLCLRGAESDLVLRETTAEMMLRGPGTSGLTQVVEIESCGHAPALNVPDQLERVAAFIDAAG